MTIALSPRASGFPGAAFDADQPDVNLGIIDPDRFATGRQQQQDDFFQIQAFDRAHKPALMRRL
ncbi:hypothetical protein E0H22_11285 [Rhodopseudomonas boonkerdii]|uniref:hypothetical protein n=1 Tax=Rhodopseudomonas boonkerdii TaxID=475937 RepID=UPI001E41E9FF|nr:hypothetical protein [Rhodopseudomonas boonkerdii]UGV26222.1 hypothetical protein E0H22_11285 [Rhodopseudomonas boonkerdii]